ncbi:hypothetical protein GCM10007216_03770 [Thalassobacillus devorans]|uniref:GIY-YIG domain-containing protein n=1 Tax=Thalassobacillus devorans TaxID=279813 RepID=A0ABQ1NGG0_9BACI|nr:hypothetical protein [Thalassobacillus devorans]NIK27285.1 hypothetical protein [Thalassobacillus devorans]GGC76465.1 hypothetical protein GCM10007216_03770 [Thalassobacillus devorans]
MNAFERFEHLSARVESFKICIPTIVEKKGKLVDFDLNELTWHQVKFLSDNETLHSEMNTIPNNIGGIYMFRIKSDILPSLINYPMYIGRAQYNDGNYSLKTRCRSYKNDKRVTIQKLIHYWGRHLYISYTPLDDNELIVDLEKWLIASVLPVYNPKIDEVETKNAVRMFNR